MKIEDWAECRLGRGEIEISHGAIEAEQLFDGPRVTTTHVQHVNTMAGYETGAIEIVGKPYDLDLIVAGVKKAIARPSRRAERLNPSGPVFLRAARRRLHTPPTPTPPTPCRVAS
jgi:hypothetical protein